MKVTGDNFHQKPIAQSEKKNSLKYLNMPFRVTSCGLAGIEICLAKANVAPSHLAGYDT